MYLSTILVSLAAADYATGQNMPSIARFAGIPREMISAEPMPLSVVYPPDGHETTAAQIFLIGTAPAAGAVTVNGQSIGRSPAGHFAPSLPLQIGQNTFVLRYGAQSLTLRVNRVAAGLPAPVGLAFAVGSLTPAAEIARLPNEPICFSAVAPAGATVTVQLGDQTIPLFAQASLPDLPPNSAVLTNSNQPLAITAPTYRGCATAGIPGGAGSS